MTINIYTPDKEEPYDSIYIEHTGITDNHVTVTLQGETASKYDSNKFSQNMATAMQIGTILLMILACVL